MNDKVELDEFAVMGISIKTTNQNGQSGKDIGQLFGEFWEKGIIDKIPNKLSKDIYCVYYEYEGDFNAPYSVMLGCRVENLMNIQSGLVGLNIPRNSYLRFDSYGKLPDSLIKTWSEIWNSEIDRRYSFDFDVYPENSTDSGQVQTFVSVN